MKNKLTRSVLAFGLVLGFPLSAQAAESAATWSIWNLIMSWLFGQGGHGKGGGGGGSSVPELGAEGMFAAAVVVLAGAALLLERRRRRVEA